MALHAVFVLQKTRRLLRIGLPNSTKLVLIGKCVHTEAIVLHTGILFFVPFILKKVRVIFYISV